jgi:(4S)-4-hydroxy-5-phosphonooxypentane-2,3-dione isomerase
MRGLMARYHASEGQADLVERTLQEMADAVKADEPACLVYRAARSTEDPDVFILYEEYTDEEALLAHRETRHFRDLIEGVIAPALMSREREILVPLLSKPDDSGGRP